VLSGFVLVAYATVLRLSSSSSLCLSSVLC